MADEQVGFDVNEEIVVSDLDVKRDRPVLPVTQGVSVKIVGGQIRKDRLNNKEEESEQNPWTYAYINLNLELTEGVMVAGELKYKGSRFFTQKFDLGLTHNPAVKVGRWWEKRQYAIGTRLLIMALGFDPANPPKFNDEFLTTITDRQVLVDVTQEEINTKNESGNWVGTGEYKNRFNNWKPIE